MSEALVPKDMILPAEWGNVDPEVLMKAVGRNSTIHALYSYMPLVCKGEGCLFHQACYSWQNHEVKLYSRCIPEISAIINLTQMYKDSLNVDDSNFIDLTLIKDLVICDIMIERCNKVLSFEDMYGETPKAINSKGMVINEPAEHICMKILDKWSNKKYRILDNLNATQKAKAKVGLGANKLDLSKVLINLKKELESNI